MQNGVSLCHKGSEELLNAKQVIRMFIQVIRMMNLLFGKRKLN